MNISPDKKKEFFNAMILIRRFDTTVQDLCLKGKIPGIYHVYLGEEASGVGVCGALNKDDYILSTHRGNGHCIAKGGDVKKLMAEFYGKSTGYSHGRGGSMHIFSNELGILGSNGIVGGGLALAIGAAYHVQQQKTGRVCVCFFGDGASNQGIFHESLNLAAVRKLPVIFVCENNLYATETPIGQSTLTRDIADRAAAYGMPGVIADGNDVLDVYAKASEAVTRARSGQGPTLLENKTYRTCGHYVGHMETGYRSRDEIKDWRTRDPIEMFSRHLIEEGILKSEEIEKMQEQAKQDVEEALKYGQESPLPNPQDALDFVTV